jgi:RNA polymerase sigma factor (TIGR02999 family)
LASTTVSSLISQTESGDPAAADALFSALYAELHEIARRQLSGSGSPTFGPTTLLHEAYIRMAGREGASFPDRPRFMGYAAKVMRTIVIDHARRRAAQKRGGKFHITTLDDETNAAVADDREILQVGEALEGLAAADPPLADLVDLRFFCGFSFAEISAIRGSSERTLQRQWEKARMFLQDRIRRGSS